MLSLFVIVVVFIVVAILVLSQIFSWGFNNCGQLGHGDVTSRYVPTKVSGSLGEASNSTIFCTSSLVFKMHTSFTVQANCNVYAHFVYM